jgi:hypothetical protein
MVSKERASSNGWDPDVLAWIGISIGNRQGCFQGTTNGLLSKSGQAIEIARSMASSMAVGNREKLRPGTWNLRIGLMGYLDDKEEPLAAKNRKGTDTVSCTRKSRSKLWGVSLFGQSEDVVWLQQPTTRQSFKF